MYDNVRKPESDWYEAGYTAPRTDAAGTGCYDSYWSPSQAAAPKKKSHQGLKITMIMPCTAGCAYQPHFHSGSISPFLRALLSIRTGTIDIITPPKVPAQPMASTKLTRPA